jgi:hypothetical protein
MKSKNKSGMRYFLMYMMAAAVTYGSTEAIAAPPEAVPPADFAVDLPPGLACDFPLRLEGSGGNRHLREFTDENGNVVRSLDAGTGSALRFTNLANGETFSTKSNGAVSHISYNPDGSYTQTSTGHNILILFPTDFPAGPSTTLIVGSVVFTVDLDEVFTLQKVSGKETDICNALS